MDLHTIGIDLGKTVFHLVGLNPRGEVVVRKKFSRTQLLHFTANRHVEDIQGHRNVDAGTELLRETALQEDGNIAGSPGSRRRSPPPRMSHDR
jgi:hypothetical protein